MGHFILRRLIAMVGVLFAISVLTFAIFNVIPNSDPAQRMAGRNQTGTRLLRPARRYADVMRQRLDLSHVEALRDDQLCGGRRIGPADQRARVACR